MFKKTLKQPKRNACSVPLETVVYRAKLSNIVTFVLHSRKFHLKMKDNIVDKRSKTLNASPQLRGSRDFKISGLNWLQTDVESSTSWSDETIARLHAESSIRNAPQLYGENCFFDQYCIIWPCRFDHLFDTVISFTFCFSTKSRS